MQRQANDEDLLSREQAASALRILASGLVRAVEQSAPVPVPAPSPDANVGELARSEPRIARVPGNDQASRLGTDIQALGEQLRSSSSGLQGFSGELKKAGGELEGIVNALARTVGGGLAANATGGLGLGSLLSSGLGIFSLGRSIAGLFQSDDAEEPQITTPYEPPPSLALAIERQSSPPTVGATRIGAASTLAPANAPRESNVTVNIHALDSQSFLDRSSELADAVKDAVLRSHSLGDVVGQL